LVWLTTDVFDAFPSQISPFFMPLFCC
jgi:hypothetical protein